MRIAKNAEYIALRLIRKFLLNERIVRRLYGLLPYYELSRGESVPEEIVDLYERHLRSKQEALEAKTVLELGAGHGNGTAYELAARGASAVFAVEPWAELDCSLDQRLRSKSCFRHRVSEEALRRKVRRLTATSETPSGAVDLALSHSVLEHVGHSEGLFSELRRVLRPGGCMLHVVDYRDHFFKYPYHFLQFPRKVWDRYLNPGDLPRWRLSDHLRMLKNEGFVAEILEKRSDDAAFARIRPYISKEFDLSDAYLSVTSAVLFARKD